MKTKPNDSVTALQPIWQGTFQIAEEKEGLTKREYFAALAMQGLCVPSIPGGHNSNDKYESLYKAQMAVRLADMLIEELNKEN